MENQVKIRAVLMDCNGVIADDEPIHLELLQKVLAEEGIVLTRAEYFAKYLAMDDRGCFIEAYRVNGKKMTPEILQELIARKAAYYHSTIGPRLKIFDGVKKFAETHRKKFAMAVVSGALRKEIDLILKAAKIENCFDVIVSAEEVAQGKPDPECYSEGLRRLNELPQFAQNPISPDECVAIEDSIHGVDAAIAAGFWCVAVTNSYAAADLAHADSVVDSLEDLVLSEFPVLD